MSDTTPASGGTLRCSVRTCGEPSSVRGWCPPHYQRWRRYGDPLGAPQPREPEYCTVLDCGDLRYCRDYCRAHYARWQRHGDPSVVIKATVRGRSGCLIDDCERKHHCQGYCKAHYHRLRKTGSAGSAQVGLRRKAAWSEDGTEGTCFECGKTKPVDDFYMGSIDPDSPLYKTRLGQCKGCMKAAGKTWRDANPEMIRERQVGYRLQFFYRITSNQYDALLAAQGGGCAICGDTRERSGRRLAVDHDHSTGVVRGVLCWTCNTAIGLFGEDERIMARAAKYLEEGGA